MATRMRVVVAVLFAFSAGAVLRARPAAAKSIKEMIEEARKEKEAQAKKEEEERKAKAATDKAEADAAKAKAGKSLKEMMEDAKKAGSAPVAKESEMEKAMREKLEASKDKPPPSIIDGLKDRYNKWKDGLNKKEEKDKTLLDKWREQQAGKGKSVEELMKEKAKGGDSESLDQKMKKALGK